jgi:hypothetical protein
MLFFFLILLICLIWGLVWLASAGNFLLARYSRSAERISAAKWAFKRTSSFGVGLGLLVYLLFFPPLWLVFHAEFGQFPWFAVRELRGKADSGYDYRQIDMRFKATPEKVRQLVKATSLQRQKKVAIHSMQAPEWGNPVVTSDWWVFNGDKRPHKKFTTEEKVILAYNTKTQVAFYSYSGMD